MKTTDRSTHLTTVSASRRDVLKSSTGLATAAMAGAFSASMTFAAEYDPATSVNLTTDELAIFKDPARLRHLFTAKPLVNRQRANEIMDRHGLDALVAAVPKNVYYLSSHDNAFYHTGIEHMLFALLPRREDAPPALIIWGALLYHLDYRPTWMQSVEIYTAPAGTPTPQDMLGDPAAIRYNRNLVRRGAKYTERDKFQLALAAQYADRPSASALHALKRAIRAAGLTKGKIAFDDLRVIPWLKDVGLPDIVGVDGNDVFKEVRMVKSATEIELMRETSRRSEAALNAAIASLHVGQEIADVELQYRRKIGDLGGDTRWLIINQDGLNSGRIERDKVIKIDSVGDYLGYVGDIGRSIVVGQPTDETAGRNRANAKALREAYMAIRPGIRFDAVSKIVADVMRQEGFNGFGAVHNVGMDHTDQPTAHAHPLRRIEPLTFSEGTVFTIDVPYLEIGYGSSHVEDMMVCTPRGAVPLSSGDVSLRVRPA